MECLVAYSFEANNIDNSNLLEVFSEVIEQSYHRLISHSLIDVHKIGVPRGRKKVALSRDDTLTFLNIIEETVHLTSQAMNIHDVDRELMIWQQIFGYKFPKEL